jgi:MFS family permease
MPAREDRLFTPRFFVMCGFSFTVFLSVFQILPIAPFHILELGGSTFASGLFLGCLTYASAFSAPLTGAIGDRLGHRRILLVSSLAIAGFSVAYGLSPGYRLMLGLAILHGVFWSGLLSASGAYMTEFLPARRRAEGIGYWGLSSVIAVAVAPNLGFWIFGRGWLWVCASSFTLNVAMALIAWRLPETEQHARGMTTEGSRRAQAVVGVESDECAARIGEPETRRRVLGRRALVHLVGALEWRVLALSLTLFLYSFGYGGITSFTALYAAERGVTPRGIYLTALALVILASRPISVPVADRLGYTRVFIPCLILIPIGLGLLMLGGTRTSMVLSAVVFGLGFGTAYPVFVAHIMQRIHAARRGAAFGAMLAAFDTGIGTGSTAMGALIERLGFENAFGVAAAVSALALPYFLIVNRRVGSGAHGSAPATSR